MTGAELKTLRESLGLTAQWCAENVGRVSNIRSWQRWEAGDIPVPVDVADQITSMDAAVTLQSMRAVEAALEVTEREGSPSGIDLYRYDTDAELAAAKPDMAGLPASFHAAILARTRLRLLDAGFQVSIHFA